MTHRYTVTLTLAWDSDDTATAQREVTEAVALLEGDAFDVESVGALDEVDA